MEEFGEYSYCGYSYRYPVNPFDDGVMDCSGRGYDLARMNETAIDHGFAYMLDDAGDWWIFCRVFLLEETPIRQT